MTSIKDMKAFDQEGLAVNKVETSLLNVGIHLRDNNGHFRDMQDVLTEIGDNWENINTEDRLYIAEQIAGIRQKETFLTLMSNQVEMQKQLTAETNSTGLAEERYATYQKSVEAAQNRMTASWEKLAMSGATSEMIAGFYDATAGVLDLINAIGGLKTVLIAAGLALAFYYSLQIKVAAVAVWNIIATGWALVATTTEAATVAQWAFNLALNANPIGVVIGLVAVLAVGLYGLYSAYDYLSVSIEEVNEQYNELKTSFDKSKSNADNMRELAKTFDELKTKARELGGVSKLSAEEQQKLLDVQAGIKEIVPEVAGYYDEMGNFILAASVSYSTLTTATENQVKAQQKLLEAKAIERINLETEAFAKQAEEIKVLSIISEKGFKSIHEWIMRIVTIIPGIGQTIKSIAGMVGLEDYITTDIDSMIEKLKTQTEESANKIKVDFYTITDKTQQDLYLATLEGTGAWGKKLADELRKSLEELPPVAEEVGQQTSESLASTVTEEMEKALDDILKITIDMIKQQKKAEKDALQDQLKDIKDKADAQKDYYKFQLDEIKRVEDERKTALQREMEDQKRLWDAQKQAIQDQLDAYESIIDKEKELLNLQKEAADFAADKADKESALTKVEQQIAILANDTSEAGIAQKLMLEAQAAEMRKKLAEDEANRTLELQTQALDAEKQTAQESANLQLSELERNQQEYEYNHELQLRALEDEQYAAERRYEIIVAGLDAQVNAQEEALKAQIEAIDQYLQEEGTIRNDAMAMIKDQNSGLYEELLAWNLKYGSGINDEIVANWDLARQAAQGYADVVNALPTSTGNAPGAGGTGDNWSSDSGSGINATAGVGATTSTGTSSDESTWWNPFTWHDGIDKGFVGGQPKLKSNEQFAKLLTGEVVINPAQMESFMAKTLPSMMGSPTTASNMTGGGVSFNNLLELNVSGNLDTSTIPTIENIVKQAIEKLNNSMTQRGYTRSANAFSI